METMTHPAQGERMKMLPCPFCGGTKFNVVETEFKPEKRLAYAVACMTVDCAASVFTLGFGRFKTREQAIKEWNRRAHLSQLQRERDEDRACIRDAFRPEQTDPWNAYDAWAKKHAAAIARTGHE